MTVLLVDCGSCTVRGPACRDCFVSVLLGPVGRTLELAEEEHRALGVLAAAGLVPPLRLVPPRSGYPLEESLKVV